MCSIRTNAYTTNAIKEQWKVCGFGKDTSGEADIHTPIAQDAAGSAGVDVKKSPWGQPLYWFRDNLKCELAYFKKKNPQSFLLGQMTK